MSGDIAWSTDRPTGSKQNAPFFSKGAYIFVYLLQKTVRNRKLRLNRELYCAVKIIFTKANGKNLRDAFRFGHPDFLLFSELSVVGYKFEKYTCVLHTGIFEKTIKCSVYM